VATNSQSIARFDCCAAACLWNRHNIQEYWWIQEVTGVVWIGLEQNVINAAINEWRKCLRAEPMFVGQHFKHFCTQLKNEQLDKLLAKMMKLWTKCVFCVFFWLSNNTKVVKMQYFVRFLFPRSAETDIGWRGKLNSHLMASCIRNIRTTTYWNWITFFQVMIKKILVCFYAPQCSYFTPSITRPTRDRHHD